MRETTIESTVCAYLRKRGGLETKLTNSRGWPDRLFVLPNGRTLFVEFKSPTGRLRPGQKIVLNKLHRMRHHAHIIDSVVQGKLIIDNELR